MSKNKFMSRHITNLEHQGPREDTSFLEEIENRFHTSVVRTQNGAHTLLGSSVGREQIVKRCPKPLRECPV